MNSIPYLGQTTNTLSGIYAAMADIIGTNPANNSYFGAGTGRSGVPKVIVVVTDGVSNAPCVCSNNGNRFLPYGGMQFMTCQGMYGGTSTNYQNQCKSSTRYPGLSCGDCPNNNCFPCADPIKLTEQINSWNTTATGTTPPSSMVPAAKNFLNWKVVALGVGDLLDNSFGQSQISGMNYDHDPSKMLLVKWQNLASVVSTVIDASCNT